MRIPLIVFLVVAAVSVLLDLGIWRDVRHYAARPRRAGRIYMASSVVCWLFVGVVLLLPRRDASRDISFVMWGLYGYLTVYVAKFVYMLLSLLRVALRLSPAARFKPGLQIGLPAAVLVFIVMWWGALVGRSQIEVVRVDYDSPNVPRMFDGYKIVQFSDLHVGTWGDDTRFVAKLVDSINALRPDLIVFTGDIVNRQTSEILPFVHELSRLKAKDGVYSVLGNHDYGDYADWTTEEAHMANNRLLIDIQESMGWRMLNNSRAAVTRRGTGEAIDTLMLIGVENWGDPPFKVYGDLNKAYPLRKDSDFNVNDHRFKVLLTHNPEHWNRETSENTNIDLTLSGHTHAMQMQLRIGDFRWSPAVFRYPLWGGMYSRCNASGRPVSLYVNIGSGEVGLPYRIGAPSEITLITLRHRVAQPKD